MALLRAGGKIGVPSSLQREILRPTPADSFSPLTLARFFSSSAAAQARAQQTEKKALLSPETERLQAWQRRLQNHRERVKRAQEKALRAQQPPVQIKDPDSWSHLLSGFDPRTRVSRDEIYQKLGLEWVDEGMGVDARSAFEGESAKPLYLERGRCRKLWFNRPHALNAVDLQMVRSLERVLPKWENWDTVRGVVWLSKLTDTFCAGVDVRALSTYSEAEWEEFYRLQARFQYYLYHSRVPLTPLASGASFGFGAAVILNAPCTFATERTFLAVPAVTYGFFPDASLSFHLSRAGAIGKFLALTGYQLTGEDLVKLGFLQLYSTHDQAKTIELGYETLWSNKVDRVAYLLLNCCSQMPPAPIEKFMDIIERCFSHDKLEEICNALALETDTWARDILGYIKSACPLSLKVTMELLHRASALSIEDCLRMEYRLAMKFRTLPDYVEGVNARILNPGTSAPNWRPLSEITEEEIQELFVPIDGEEKLLEGLKVPNYRRPPIKQLFPALLEYESKLYTTIEMRKGQPTLLPFQEIARRLLPPDHPIPKMDTLVEQAMASRLQSTSAVQEDDEPTTPTPTPAATTTATADSTTTSEETQLEEEEAAGKEKEVKFNQALLEARKRLIGRLRGINRPGSQFPLYWEDRF